MGTMNTSSQPIDIPYKRSSSNTARSILITQFHSPSPNTTKYNIHHSQLYGSGSPGRPPSQHINNQHNNDVVYTTQTFQSHINKQYC